MERSAGAVIFYNHPDKNNREYLLLYAPNSKGTGGYWGFPKGHVEEGESDLDAARREIEEETGINNIEFIPNFQAEDKYVFRRDKKTIFKTVTFFLARSESQEIKISFEHTDYKWLLFEEARELASFENSKKMLRNAEEFLNRNKNVPREGLQPS